MAEWYEDQSFLKGLDEKTPPISGPAPTPAPTPGKTEWFNDDKFLKGLDGPQIPEEKPSYGEIAKTKFKEGLAGAMRMYEIPSRPILEKTGLAAPGTFASEQLTPTKEEEERTHMRGIPGEVLGGFAGLPGAFAKYGPLMALAPESILGTALLGGGEEAAEELAGGKKLSPLEIIEQAATLGIFKGIEPLGKAARMGILAGTFSVPAFAQTYSQTKDVVQSLKAGISPAIVGGAMGLMGGGKEERPIPRPGEGEPLQIPTIPESRYQMGTPGYPKPEELPHPIVPYRGGEPPMDMVWNPETRTFETPEMAPEAVTPPTPAPTPPQEVKAPEAPVKPPTDKQMATIRGQADKLDGLSIDMIKRWTGLGTKRANAILEDLVNKGEIVPGGPDSRFPWKFKEEPSTLPPDFKTGFIPGTYKDKLSKEFNDIINKRFPDDEGRKELEREVAGLYFAVEHGQPGKRIFIAAGRVGEGSNLDVMGEASTYPEFISKNKLTRKTTLRALEKGIRGEKLGKAEEDIYIKARLEGREAIAERKAQDERYDKEYSEILGRKPELTNPELTNHFDDEIMGLEEDLRENYTDSEINTAIEEATKNLPAEGTPTEIADLEREIRSLLPKVEPPTPEIPKVEGLTYIGKDTGIPEGMALEPNHHFNITEEAAAKAGVPDAEGATITTTDISPDNLKKMMDAKIEEFRKAGPALSPTVKDQYALPGIKQGLEMKGAKEGVTPTLEGTPLGEAARKAEIEILDKNLFILHLPYQTLLFYNTTDCFNIHINYLQQVYSF